MLGVLAVACGGPSKPEGWMPPSPVDGEGVLDGDTLYLSRDKGKISSYDASGDALVENWTFGGKDELACANEGGKATKRDLKGIYGAPAIYQDRVFFGAYDGNVYALDSATGACVWVFDGTDGPIVGGVALAGDILYFGSDDGNLYGVDPTSGALTHGPFEAGASIWTTPLYEGDNIYFATVEAKVWALTAADLHPAWSNGPFTTSAGLLTDPIIIDGVLMVGGIGKQLFGLDPETGEQVWESPFDAGNWFWGDPAVDGGTAYYPNMDGKVYAVIAKTGKAAWEAPFPAIEAIRSAPLLADGSLTIVDREGNVFTVDPETGKAQTANPVVLDKKILANPALVNGSVLVVAQNGDMFELDPKGQEPPKAVQVAN
jgi:outer membrane protein assembly factor BamB